MITSTVAVGIPFVQFTALFQSVLFVPFHDVVWANDSTGNNNPKKNTTVANFFIFSPCFYTFVSCLNLIVHNLPDSFKGLRDANLTNIQKSSRKGNQFSTQCQEDPKK